MHVELLHHIFHTEDHEKVLLKKSTKKERLIPDLSSDEWTVLCAVHVGVEGHLEVLWRHTTTSVVNAGDTHKHLSLAVHAQYITNCCR